MWACLFSVACGSWWDSSWAAEGFCLERFCSEIQSSRFWVWKYLALYTNREVCKSLLNLYLDAEGLNEKLGLSTQRPTVTVSRSQTMSQASAPSQGLRQVEGSWFCCFFVSVFLSRWHGRAKKIWVPSRRAQVLSQGILIPEKALINRESRKWQKHRHPDTHRDWRQPLMTTTHSYTWTDRRNPVTSHTFATGPVALLDLSHVSKKMLP